MGFLAAVLRALGPLALEHGTPVLREWWKGRAAQAEAKVAGKAVKLEELASDVEQLQAHAGQVDSNLDALAANLEKLNDGLTAREEKLRKALLVLLLWNVAMTLGLLLLAVFAFRR